MQADGGEGAQGDFTVDDDREHKGVGHGYGRGLCGGELAREDAAEDDDDQEEAWQGPPPRLAFALAAEAECQGERLEDAE